MTKLLGRDAALYHNFVHVALVQEVQELLESARGTEQYNRAHENASRRLRVGGLAHSLAAEAARRDLLQDVGECLAYADDLSTASGQLFLRAARLAEENSNVGQVAVRDRLDSSIEFLVGHRLAVAAAVARPTVRWLSQLPLPIERDQQLALVCLRILAGTLAGGGMPSGDEFSLFARADQPLDMSKESSSESAERALRDLSSMMHVIGNGLRMGDLRAARLAVSDLTVMLVRIEEIVNGEISDLYLRFAGVVGFLAEHSVWNVPGLLGFVTPDVGAELVKHLIDQKRYFLFPAQMRALNTGSLIGSERSHIISMPTGSGKTLLATFTLLKHLVDAQPSLGENRSRVFYLVPSRALAKEKVEELRSLFSSVRSANAKVCQLTGDLILNAGDAIRDYDVIVATPEKFDMLLRVPELRVAVGAVLVDEFHNVRTDGRGLRLLVALARLRSHPETCRARLHLISAIVKSEDLLRVRNWLDRLGGPDSSRSIEFQSREAPIFIRTGVFDFKEQRTNASWKIVYDDGSSKTVPGYTGDNAPLTSAQHGRAAQHLALSLLDEGAVLLFATAAQWRWNKEWKQFSTMPLQQAVELASKMLKLPAWTDLQAHRGFVEKLSKLLGSEHKMVEAARMGVSAHWGGLPVRARRLVESAVLDRGVAILVATSTLAEGVNLPFKRVIISKCDIAGRPFDIGFFLNLKGRVGRPFLTEEGEVILIRSQKVEGEWMSRLQKATADDVEPLRSPVAQISAFREALESTLGQEEGAENPKKNIRLDELLESLDTAVLALVAEGFVIEESLLDRLSSLLSLEADELDGAARQEISACVSRLTVWELIEQVGKALMPTEFGKRVYESGFPPGSAVAARQSLKPIDMTRILLVPSTPISGQAWEFLVAVCEILSRTRAWSTLARVGVKSHKQAALFAKDWTQGALLRDIAKSRGEADRLYMYSMLEGTLAPLLAWFIFSLSLWISDRAEFPMVSDDVVRRLQAWSEFLWFGAPPSRALALLKHDFVGRLFRDDILVIDRLGGALFWAEMNGPVSPSSDASLRQVLQGLQEHTVDSPEYLLQVLRDLIGNGQ